MAYKIHSIIPVDLQEAPPSVGYILILEDLTTNQLVTLWGSTASGYNITDWGYDISSSTRYRQYQDGFTSMAIVNGVTNTQTITKATESKITNIAVLDLNTAIVGVKPDSLGEMGITQIVAAGGTINLSTETYKAWARVYGWLLSATATESVIATKPNVYINFMGFPMIANYIEVTIVPTGTSITTNMQRMLSRVRWGDSQAALCGSIIYEDAATNNAGFIDLVDTPGDITGMMALSDRIVVTKSNSLYELTYINQPLFFAASLISRDVGCVAPESLIKYKTGCVFVGNNNIYTYSAGGQFKPIGNDIYPIFYGTNPTYTPAQITKATMTYFPDRETLWLWLRGVDNIVYKYVGGGWFKLDYTAYTFGNITAISAELLSTYEGIIPILCFNENDPCSVSAGTATVKVHYDLQGASNSVNEIASLASATTVDFPLTPEGRILGMEFQATCDLADGKIMWSYSINEGQTFSDVTTIPIKSVSALQWYTYTINTTCESIRFKFETYDPISLGKMQLNVISRLRGKEQIGK